jgi:hypothetical protein
MKRMSPASDFVLTQQLSFHVALPQLSGISPARARLSITRARGISPARASYDHRLAPKREWIAIGPITLGKTAALSQREHQQ